MWRPSMAVAVSGAHSLLTGALKNIICQNAAMSVGTANANSPPKKTSQGVISILRGGCVAQPLGERLYVGIHLRMRSIILPPHEAAGAAGADGLLSGASSHAERASLCATL